MAGALIAWRTLARPAAVRAWARRPASAATRRSAARTSLRAALGPARWSSSAASSSPPDLSWLDGAAAQQPSFFSEGGGGDGDFDDDDDDDDAEEDWHEHEEEDLGSPEDPDFRQGWTVQDGRLDQMLSSQGIARHSDAVLERMAREAAAGALGAMARPGEFAVENFGVSMVIRGAVSRKTVGGNVRRIKVTCVIGNGQGFGGVGSGKSLENMAAARTKAIHAALKNTFYIPRYRNRTIYHPLRTKFGTTQIDMWPRRPGSGIRAPLIPRHLFDRLGITDIGVKFHGSHDKMAQLKSTVKALTLQETHEKLARRRGIMLPRLDYPDYLRVCRERGSEQAKGMLRAPLEPAVYSGGRREARTAPSPAVLDSQALLRNRSYRARKDRPMAEFYAAKREARLSQLRSIEGRSADPVLERLLQAASDKSAQLWAEKQAALKGRTAEADAFEASLDYDALTPAEEALLGIGGPERLPIESDEWVDELSAHQRGVWDMYSKRVVESEPEVAAIEAAADAEPPPQASAEADTDGKTLEQLIACKVSAPLPSRPPAAPPPRPRRPAAVCLRRKTQRTE